MHEAALFSFLILLVAVLDGWLELGLVPVATVVLFAFFYLPRKRLLRCNIVFTFCVMTLASTPDTEHSIYCYCSISLQYWKNQVRRILVARLGFFSFSKRTGRTCLLAYLRCRSGPERTALHLDWFYMASWSSPPKTGDSDSANSLWTNPQCKKSTD